MIRYFKLRYLRDCNPRFKLDKCSMGYVERNRLCLLSFQSWKHSDESYHLNDKVTIHSEVINVKKGGQPMRSHHIIKEYTEEEYYKEVERLKVFKELLK